MDPQEVARQERDMEQVRRELERKSHDTWRVYNPLDASVNFPQVGHNTPWVDHGNFVFYYDGYPNRVPPKAFKDMEFFRVRKYYEAISNFMINQLREIKGQEILEKHRALGQGEYLDKYVENINVWDKVPRHNDETLLKKIADEVVIGLVEEYGLDLAPPSAAPMERTDTRSLHDQILGTFSRKIAPEVEIAKAELKKDKVDLKEVEAEDDSG